MLGIVHTVTAQHNLNKAMAFDFKSLEGDWEGIWKNTTFGSTDSIFATMSVDTDSKKVHVEIKTKGIFGDPTPVHYIYDESYTEEMDTVRIAPPNGLVGEIVVSDDGNITGQITQPMFNLTVDFTGTWSESNIDVNYVLSGGFVAEGFVQMVKVGMTDVQQLAEDDLSPGSFRLLGNYPNPFNPETVIPIQISTPGYVSLQIYNISGQMVRHLVNEELGRGYYSVLWDGRDESGRSMSSGAYVARLTSNGRIATQRMLMVK
jgi:hypothetical protein